MKKYWMVLALLLPGCVLMNSAANLPDTPEAVLPTAANTLAPGTGSPSDTPALSPRILTPTPLQPVAKSPTAGGQKTPVSVPPQVPAAPVSLQVRSPQDQSIVNSSTITVIGTTSPDAVVSVNGQLATVSPSGSFQLTISLDEGPNDIEVVASDANGNELSSILSVIYQP